MIETLNDDQVAEHLELVRELSDVVTGEATDTALMALAQVMITGVFIMRENDVDDVWTARYCMRMGRILLGLAACPKGDLRDALVSLGGEPH